MNLQRCNSSFAITIAIVSTRNGNIFFELISCLRTLYLRYSSSACPPLSPSSTLPDRRYISLFLPLFSNSQPPAHTSRPVLFSSCALSPRSSEVNVRNSFLSSFITCECVFVCIFPHSHFTRMRYLCETFCQIECKISIMNLPPYIIMFHLCVICCCVQCNADTYSALPAHGTH